MHTQATLEKGFSRAANLWEINGFRFAGTTKKRLLLKDLRAFYDGLSANELTIGWVTFSSSSPNGTVSVEKVESVETAEPWSQSVAFCEYFFCNVSHA
jgi:hypothetical protein